MNNLLEYLKEIVEELEVLSNDLFCGALQSERSQINSIVEGLADKIKYYEGFNAEKNEEKKTQTKLVIVLHPKEHEAFFKSDFYRNYIKE